MTSSIEQPFEGLVLNWIDSQIYIYMHYYVYIVYIYIVSVVCFRNIYIYMSICLFTYVIYIFLTHLCMHYIGQGTLVDDQDEGGHRPG